MNYTQWFRFSERQRGFTLIEVIVSLLVVGIFTGMLIICMARIADFLGDTLGQMVRYQEVRTFCRFLTTDCKQAIFRHDKSGPAFLKDGKGIFLLRRVSLGWKQISPEQDGTICAVRYEFSPEAGIVTRTLWGDKDTLAALMAGGSYSDTLLQKVALSTKRLLRNVNHFQMRLVDSMTQQQEPWGQRRAVSLEFSFAVPAGHEKKSEIFFVNIPLLKSAF